jgi:hypothetical protein
MLIGRRLRLLQAERAEIAKAVKFEWVDSMWACSSENLGRDILESFNPFPGDINAMKIVPSRVFAKAATLWRISYSLNTLSTETNLALLHTDVDAETTSNRCNGKPSIKLEGKRQRAPGQKCVEDGLLGLALKLFARIRYLRNIRCHYCVIPALED